MIIAECRLKWTMKVIKCGYPLVSWMTVYSHQVDRCWQCPLWRPDQRRLITPLTVTPFPSMEHWRLHSSMFAHYVCVQAVRRRHEFVESSRWPSLHAEIVHRLWITITIQRVISTVDKFRGVSFGGYIYSFTVVCNSFSSMESRRPLFSELFMSCDLKDRTW